jgi:hypothetical protein
MKKVEFSPDELRFEYKRPGFEELVRRKHCEPLAASSNVVVLHAAASSVFPDSAAVNKLLRSFVDIEQEA